MIGLWEFMVIFVLLLCTFESVSINMCRQGSGQKGSGATINVSGEGGE